MLKQSNARWIPWLATAGLALFLCCGGNNSDGGNGGTASGGAPGNGGVTGTGGAAVGGNKGTGGSSSTATNLPAVTVACHAWCAKEDHCNPDTTVEDCYAYRCHEGAGNGTPVGDASYSAACQAAGKAYFDCLTAQPDVCDVAAITTACQSKTAAYSAACS
jgi:hypothetical protein